jgi:hypothetical protein
MKSCVLVRKVIILRLLYTSSLHALWVYSWECYSQKEEVQTGACLFMGGNLPEATTMSDAKYWVFLHAHIIHCLCSSNSPSIVLYFFQTHCTLMMLCYAICTFSHGWRTGWRVVASRIQPKFKWLKKLHYRSFVVASRNESCNCLKMFKATAYTCFLVPPHLRYGSCLLTFWSYHILEIQVFHFFNSNTSVISFFFFSLNGLEHNKCMYNVWFSQWRQRRFQSYGNGGSKLLQNYVPTNLHNIMFLKIGNFLRNIYILCKTWTSNDKFHESQNPNLNYKTQFPTHFCQIMVPESSVFCKETLYSPTVPHWSSLACEWCPP